MKNKTLNVKLIWKQFEDHLAPRLGLSITDRAVYSHLLRHSRLEGKLRLHFSIFWLARQIGTSAGPVRESVRRLVVHGVLRLIERNKSGHLVEVRLPDEVRAARPKAIPALRCAGEARDVHLEETDFLKTRPLRQSIHLRERGLCFYCLRRIPARTQCLDHVVPKANGGSNSYRNLVSCCLECNSLKGERSAADFLRWFYREGRLNAAELTERLRALDVLASGNLRPPFAATPDPPLRPKGRPPVHMHV